MSPVIKKSLINDNLRKNAIPRFSGRNGCFLLFAFLICFSLAAPGYSQTAALLNPATNTDLAYSLPARPAGNSSLLAGNFLEIPRVERPSSARKWWILSGVALTAASMADLATSLGRNEANPALRGSNGQFSIARGASIKLSVTGATLLIQSLITRHRPDLYGPSAVVNAIGAGAFAAAAVHNRNTAP